MDKQIKHQVKQEIVSASSAGQRLDNFLFARYRSISKHHIYRIIRSGEVRVNSRRAKPMTKLSVGDSVRIPPLVLSKPGKVTIPHADRTKLEASIVSENEDFIVLDKPSGIAVHAGTGNPYGVVDIIKDLRPKDDIDLVHRIDKMSSGCLLLSKSRQALLGLHDLLRTHKLHKTYLALVAGHWQKKCEVDFRLQREEDGQSVDLAGKEAFSTFSPQRHFSSYTLVEVVIPTGRTHQIRVHAAHSGHPVAGDKRYGSYTVNTHLYQQGLRRIFLHASRLAFVWRGEAQTFQVPLPAELEKVLTKL